MYSFKNHQVSASELLEFIPDALLTHLSSTTKVDYYAKVLHGRKMFYLLFYGILENDRLSQRTLEDTFNNLGFKKLFHLDETETVVHSSISERLSKIDYRYFQEIYEFIYDKFSEQYSFSESLKYNLIRVDSTMVSEASSKLKEGIDHKNGKKSVKYTVSFDGILPSVFEVFTQPKYSSEENALPEVVRTNILKDSSHSNIYIIDRGLQSTETMRQFTTQNAHFVIRAKDKRKYKEIESLITDTTQLDLGTLTLLKDSKVYLYTGKPIQNKRGNLHYREELIEEPFRFIEAQSKEDPKIKYVFISNDFELTAKEITDFYRKRWDIETFFRFIKQELNVSHLLSLNENGIKVVLYMTLIVAIFLLLYKKANHLGYKTAKRRFMMEVQYLLIKEIVIICGGNPELFFKT